MTVQSAGTLPCTWPKSASPCGRQAPGRVASTILQALQMMNGRFVDNATDLADSMTLAAVVNSPFLDKGGKVETLFLATLSRLPTDAEVKEIEFGKDPKQRLEVAQDLAWALMNSPAFLFNR